LIFFHIKKSKKEGKYTREKKKIKSIRV
jgi:hypothetical protein